MKKILDEFKDIQNFYKFIDIISSKLQQQGFDKIGKRLHYLIHEAAWTTSTELLRGLRATLRKVKSDDKISPSLQSDIKTALETINLYFKGSYESTVWK